MFGQNKIVPPDYLDSAQLCVHSTFDTIQGEGPFAGHRAFFIRLAGCNLKCYFCDTDFEEGEMMKVEDIVKKARASNAQLIVITGGEPLAQDISLLVGLLLADDEVTVQIETSGTCFPPLLLPYRWHLRLHIVISPKTSKGKSELLEFKNVYLKYVINARDGVDPNDGLPIYSTQKRGKLKRLYRPSATDIVGEEINQWPIYVQPCFEHYAGEAGQEATTENTDLCIDIVKKYGYILSLQQHKIIGVE